MVVGSFMVLIVLVLLKRLKIRTPVVKGSALDSRAVFALRTVGDFQCMGFQVWARRSLCPPGHDFVHSTLPLVRCRSGPALRTYNFANTSF